MEKQEEDPAGVETEEEFPEEFMCFVCLDLLYKPVVLACGHISCFWCVFRAMNSWQVSHCPVCRHPYNHFPSICQLLHFLLLKLYPTTYRRREQQVIEEEKKSEHFSPQLDNCLSGLEPCKGLNIHSCDPLHSTTSSYNKVCLGSCSIAKGETSAIKGLEENTIVSHEDEKMSIPAESKFEGTENVASERNNMMGDKFNKHQNSKQVLIADMLCVICKELLYRPVVLNCGHVYCEACVIGTNYGVPRCKVCQSAHPNGYPKVCLVLEHFLEEQFSKQYALRKEAVCKQADSQNGSRSTLPGPLRSWKNAPQLSSISASDFLSCLSGQGPTVHIGVGCDYCGMQPIIGERYRCKDCKEKIGFDLCEGCYNSSSKLPGRFNQQHTPEHKLEIVKANIIADLVLRLDVEESEEDNSDAPEDMEDVASAPVLSARSPRDPEDGSAAPVSINDTSEDQEGTHSTI